MKHRTIRKYSVAVPEFPVAFRGAVRLSGSAGQLAMTRGDLGASEGKHRQRKASTEGPNEMRIAHPGMPLRI